MKTIGHILTFAGLLALALGGCKKQPDTVLQPANATTIALQNSSDSAICTVSSKPAERDFTEAGDWVRGAENPTVTIVEYGDFQCPSCAGMAPVLAQLEEDFPDDLRIIFRHYPLIGDSENIIHDKAALAAQAAEAAGRQEMFWEMHDLLFEKQTEWSALTPDQFVEWVNLEAEALGMDASQFADDMLSEELVELAQNAWYEGVSRGIGSTPYLLVDDRPLPPDYYSYQALFESLNYMIIPLNRLIDRQFSECPPMTIDPTKTYTATIVTDLGDITIALFSDAAPFAVNSFVFLAQNDWYDGIYFHRVIPGYIAQAGDPSGTGYGGPGYMFSSEIDPDLNFDRAGLFAMANSGPNSNGSQFFITYDVAPHLNGQYTIFGEVIAGMDVAIAISQQISPDDPKQLLPVLISDIQIEVK